MNHLIGAATFLSPQPSTWGDKDVAPPRTCSSEVVLAVRPLQGRSVAVTQRPDLARPTVALLRERGACVLEVPATRWGPPADQARLDRALSGLRSYDWILFSNPIGVDVFFAQFFQRYDDLRELGPARLGAYGPNTAARLREWLLSPAATAADHKTPLIMRAITQCGDVRGQRFLVLRGEVATEQVPEALTALGASVEVVASFGVEPESADPTGDAARLVEHGADWLIFASGLAIEHLHARFDLPKLLAHFPSTRLAITTTTIQWALDELGLKPAVVTKPLDVEGLVNALIRAESGAGQPFPNALSSRRHNSSGSSSPTESRIK